MLYRNRQNLSRAAPNFVDIDAFGVGARCFPRSLSVPSIVMMRHLGITAAVLGTAWFVFVPATLDATGSHEAEPVREVYQDPRGELSTDALLPFNPDVRTGRLENGLQYYLLEHAEPENVLVLRLIVDAGSVLETESQRGLAHFLEHMAFNGTERFGETELVAYLESLGIQFGPDINAYTGFDETVYKLEIPSDDPEALNIGFEVMREWASAIAFSPEAIERERGVIVEEWRTGRDAARRMLEEHIPVLLEDSRYAERLPIGDMDIVRTAPRSEFLAYYHRWYRSDNMAFVVVGDLPPGRMERLVREHLGTLRRPEEPLHRPAYMVPEARERRVSIASDPEATRSTVSIYISGAPKPFETVNDYRDLLRRSLFASIINERMRDLARDPESPIQGAGIGWNRFLRGTEIAVASAVARDSRIEDALKLLATELERARRYGVTVDELHRARSRFLESIEDSYTNLSTRPSAVLADELVRHWIEGESVPGIPFEYRLYTELLPGIAPEEVEAVAGEFTIGDGAVVLASIREGRDGLLPDGGPLPTPERLSAVLDEVSTAHIAPPAVENTPDQLMSVPPSPEEGAILDRREYAAIGTREYLLRNGMRIYLKPTDFAEDEILFAAFSPGGSSRLPDSLAPAAAIAAQVALESGIGDVDAAALERMLSGSSVSMNASISSTTERLSGSARGADLEMLFQMIHLAFTHPRFDERALENVRQRNREAIEGALASPQGRFIRRLRELYAAEDPRLTPLTQEALAAITLDQIEAVYRDRFADPGDFALFFVGSFETDRIEALIERYLAVIPGGAPSEVPRALESARFLEMPEDTGYRLPEEPVLETVRAGSEPVAQVAILLHSDFNWSREENQRFTSLGDVLDIRLRETIREEAGGSYSIGAGGWRERYPRERAYMQIGFAMDPDRAEELVDLALEVVRELRTEQVSEDYIARVTAQQLESWEQGLRENSFWLGTLEFYLFHGRDPESILTMPELIRSLDAEELRATAERYLDAERRLQVLLLPASE